MGIAQQRMKNYFKGKKPVKTFGDLLLSQLGDDDFKP